MGSRGKILAGSAALAVVLLVLSVAWRSIQIGAPDYEAVPVLEREFQFTGDAAGLQPVRLQIVSDTLFVSYNGLARLDYFDLELRWLGTIELEAPEPILPTDFRVSGGRILVGDHAKGLIAVFDRGGRYVESFGTLPDGVTCLMPIALAHKGNFVYLADMGLRRILAIALETVSGSTEAGELVLSIPAETEDPLGFPSAVHVTQDGRLLVGDSGQAKVRVFTCAGREIYSFDAVPGRTKMTPLGFAQDGVINSRIQDGSSFDPSGVRGQGRFHVADGFSGQVHLFSPLGSYLASYPEEGGIDKPSSVAVDPVGGGIYVADPPSGRILVFRSGGR